VVYLLWRDGLRRVRVPPDDARRAAPVPRAVVSARAGGLRPLLHRARGGDDLRAAARCGDRPCVDGDIDSDVVCVAQPPTGGIAPFAALARMCEKGMRNRLRSF